MTPRDCVSHSQFLDQSLQPAHAGDVLNRVREPHLKVNRRFARDSIERHEARNEFRIGGGHASQVDLDVRGPAYQHAATTLKEFPHLFAAGHVRRCDDDAAARGACLVRARGGGITRNGSVRFIRSHCEPRLVRADNRATDSRA